MKKFSLSTNVELVMNMNCYWRSRLIFSTSCVLLLLFSFFQPVLGSESLETPQGLEQSLMTNETRSTWTELATRKIFRDAIGVEDLHTVPGSMNSFSLVIARNGVDFFQVVVTAGSSALSNISVTISDLQGSNPSNKISATNIKIFLEHYIHVRSRTYFESILNYNLGYYPDALVPLRAPFTVEPNRNQPLWVEVDVPRSAIPDNYTGTITFSGGIQESISFTVEVLDFEVPDHTDLVNVAYADFWALYLAGSVNTDEEYDNLVATYTKFFTERELNVARTFDAGDVPTRNGSNEWDFSTWLETMIPLYESGGILDAFNPLVLQVPLDLEVLGYDVEDAFTTQAMNDYKDFLRQFKNYITMQTLIDLNDAKWIVWISEFDEPNSAELSELISLYYNLTQEINAEVAPFKYYFEVDGSIDWDSEAIQYDFGPDDDVSTWTRLGDRFDYWMAPQEDFEFDLPFIQDRIANGKQVLIYQQAWTALPRGSEDIPPGFTDRDYEFPSFPGIVNPALFHRILPWFLWKYGAKGIGFWATMQWYDAVNDSFLDVWVDDPALWIQFRGTFQAQNGDGWLVYPGDRVYQHTGQPNVDGPVSSLRLELLRKGFEDYKYLQLLDHLASSSNNETIKTLARQLIEEVKDLLNTITSFDRSVQKYDDLLLRIKYLLSGKKMVSALPSETSTANEAAFSIPTSWLSFFDLLLVGVIATVLLMLIKRSPATKKIFDR